MNSSGVSVIVLWPSGRAFVPVVLPAKRHPAFVRWPSGGSWRSRPGACSARGRPARRRSGKRSLGIDHPFAPSQRCEPSAKASVCQRGLFAEEPQWPARWSALSAPETAAGTAGRARAPAGRSRVGKRPSVAIQRQTTAGHDAVYVRVVRDGRAPGVQHQGGADLRAQVPGVGGDGAQRLGRDLEQQAIDHGLVPVGDLAIGAGSVKTTW